MRRGVHCAIGAALFGRVVGDAMGGEVARDVGRGTQNDSLARGEVDGPDELTARERILLVQATCPNAVKSA